LKLLSPVTHSFILSLSELQEFFFPAVLTMHTPFLSVLLSSPLVLGFPAASKVARSYGDLGLELPKELADKWYDPFDAKSNHTTPKDPGSVYSCAGPNMDNYPKKQEWLSFEQMWAINEPVMKERNKVEDYGELIRKAIEEVSTESKVDSRLILAIIMQEVRLFEICH